MRRWCFLGEGWRRREEGGEGKAKREDGGRETGVFEFDGY